MRMLATFALEWEFKPWTRVRSFRLVPGNPQVFRAQIEGGDISVVLTGIGPLNAVQSIRAAIDEASDFCIASGLAGGLKQQHRPGDVLVARSVCSEVGGEVIKSDERLVGAAVECGAKAVNHFMSAERVVRTARRKAELHRSADAVDMESFAIMREMNSLRIPCVAIRSVADSAEMDVPCDFERALDSSGHIRIMQVLGQVVCDPRQVWPMARFGAQSSRAASSLARYLDSYTRYLIAHEESLELGVQQINQ